MYEKWLGSACGGRVSLWLVTPEPGGRGTARVDLVVQGARYPYKLCVSEARELAAALLSGGDELEHPPPESCDPAPATVHAATKLIGRGDRLVHLTRDGDADWSRDFKVVCCGSSRHRYWCAWDPSTSRSVSYDNTYVSEDGSEHRDSRQVSASTLRQVVEQLREKAEREIEGGETERIFV